MNVKQRGEFLSRRVRWLGVEEIRPNPHQPRRTFEEQGLAELADSIRSYGILHIVGQEGKQIFHATVQFSDPNKEPCWEIWLRAMEAKLCGQ